MNFENKIAELRTLIKVNLTPLIGQEFILLGVPYHGNIGDSLIWKGTLNFLSTLPGKFLGSRGLDWFGEKTISKGTTLLLQGGGNFGDLYPHEQEFRLKIIEHYLDNNIIILPQSICYQNKNNIIKDVQIMSAHPKLVICARDNDSFEFLKKEFKGVKIILLPDMAFWLEEKDCNKVTDKVLYVKRTDKEFVSETSLDLQNFEISDWPTYNKFSFMCSILKVFKKLQNISSDTSIQPYISSLLRMWVERIYMPSIISTGYKFISPYNKIITTRLHAMILSIILHKKVEYIDNTSKKLSAFANTWLKNLDSVQEYSSMKF